MTDKSIVFMGTPLFAVEILKKLYTSGVHIKAVVTAPDRKSGRGQKVNESDVKKYALANDLPILQPTNLKDEDFIKELSGLNADLFVVVAFRMLPTVVWDMPPLGTINLHASLLPNYRGAAPINWAIINGETKTGVTTFFIEEQIDTGMVIEQSSIEISPNETVGTLHDRLMLLGADVMLSTVQKIFAGDVQPIPQSEIASTKKLPAPKIFKPTCEINFNQPAEAVHNFCRGLSPYPAAWCTLYNKEKDESKTYKIYGTRTTNIKTKNNKHIELGENGILIPCADYYILVTEIQPEGKRKMSFKDFLAGNSVENLVLKAIEEDLN